jgi:hypothetical protein
MLIAVCGWMNRQQVQLIDYLGEENRVLREQLGQKRLRFNNDQRRRLAVRAKGLGSLLLREVATIVTPETQLAWDRRLIAQKYDGCGKQGCGRPRKPAEIERLVARWRFGGAVLIVRLFFACVEIDNARSNFSDLFWRVPLAELAVSYISLVRMVSLTARQMT